ncbi:hypothetical protein [Paraburkholderia kirstenboschensis]|jgi:hypothetical protein|uniref:hypothetical protein n=1 Tax=Paraburkholderia kirstenboschensis TaxID=1245436 RepID=UPI003743DEC5
MTGTKLATLNTPDSGPQDISVEFEHLFPVKAPDADLDDPTQRFQGGSFVLPGQ